MARHLRFNASVRRLLGGLLSLASAGFALLCVCLVFLSRNDLPPSDYKASARLAGTKYLEKALTDAPFAVSAQLRAAREVSERSTRISPSLQQAYRDLDVKGRAYDAGSVTLEELRASVRELIEKTEVEVRGDFHQRWPTLLTYIILTGLIAVILSLCARARPGATTS